jgi:hypothetical protein
MFAYAIHSGVPYITSMKLNGMVWDGLAGMVCGSVEACGNTFREQRLE